MAIKRWETGSNALMLGAGLDSRIGFNCNRSIKFFKSVLK